MWVLLDVSCIVFVKALEAKPSSMPSHSEATGATALIKRHC